jgi:hypothetical protein
MGLINLPSTLGPAFWDKQKTALAKTPKAPTTKLGDEVKALARLHAGVDWDALGNDKLDSSDETQSRLSELEAAARGKIKILAEQAQTVEAVATKFETEAKKDKQFPKEPPAAAGTIAKSAREYRAEIDTFVADVRKKLSTRLAALNAQEENGGKGDAAKAAADAKSVQLVRARGLDAIRRIKAPAPEAKPMRFLVVQGRTTVTTYMGPSVGPAQEKLLKSLIPEDAPYKVFKDPKGELVWERKAVTFVSDVLPPGVCKKMQAWLRQTLKVNPRLRVRRTNGEAEEIDGEDIPDDLLATGAGVGTDADLAALEAALEGEREGEDGGPPDAAPSEQAAYAQRVAELQRRLRQALLDKHPESTKMRALIGFAGEKADEKKDYAEAMQALDMLEKLLDAPRPAGAAAASAQPTAPGKLAPSIVYTQTRLVWVATRGAVQAELKKLEQAILENCSGEAVQPEVTQSVRKLDRVLDLFDESLIDNLDKALNSADSAAKQHWHDEARAVIARYQSYLDTDPLVKELDGNPFVPIAVQAKLSSTLATLASKIA